MAVDEQVYSYDGTKSLTLTKWKVRIGSQLFQNTAILSYKSSDDNELDIKEPFLRYKSPSGGTVSSLLAKEGDIIHPGDELLKFQPCTHPVIMKDLCAECGADLRHLDTDNFAKLAATNTFSMVHVVPELKVNLEQAEKLGRDDVDCLLKNKKLVLLVDLDQTLIHTTNDHVSPSIKDVYHFQLYSTSNSPKYYTKLRPGTRKFLESISKYYELHICTFGARVYAHTIAKILDPDGKLFSHRILSRDECFDATSKTGNLKALFPCGDSMVCIIDDREDVWNFAPNVIHVKPYCFFRNTGDINSPSLPHLSNEKTNDSQIPKESTDDLPKDNAKISSKISSEIKASDDNGHSNDSTSNCNIKENKQSTIENKNFCPFNEAADCDDYLLYLEEILITVHKAYYDMYEQMVLQGQNSIPDLKKVVPYVRHKVLRGINIVFSSIIPTNCDPETSRYWTLAKSLGAKVSRDLILDDSEHRTTHVVASKLGTAKLNIAKKQRNIHIVSLDWLLCCSERWERADERLFPLRKDNPLNISEMDFRNYTLEIDSERSVYDTATGKQVRRWPGVRTKKNCHKPLLQVKEEKFSERVFAEAGLSLSQEDIDDMDREIEEACSSDDSEESEFLKRKFELTSSSDESLSSEDYPKSWKKKYKLELKSKLDSDCEEITEKSSSSDAETIGSVDEEMAAAVEREFQNI